MNLNKDLYLNRDFAIKRKPRIDLNIFPSVKKICYTNQNKMQNRYAKRPRDYFFENFNAINNGRIINNIITPSEKSYFTEEKQSQISRDIYGYNNYIINKNSFNTINFSSKKNHKSKQDSISNYNYSDTPNYLTTYESNSNLKFNGINNYEYQYQTTNPNTNDNSFNNSDIKFMNMKLNFKILQQKLAHLNDIASSTEKNVYKTPFKINMNAMPGYNTATKENNYPIKVFRSEVINNNNKVKKLVKTKKKENEILYQKNNRKNDIANNNIKRMKNHILSQNIITDNKKNEFELIRSKINNKKEKLQWKERYFTNDNSLSKNYKKDESELSQLADNILAMNKSTENLENNYFIKEKFETPNIKNLLQKKNNINKNKNKSHHYKYISNELEEISLNKEHNQTQNNNDQNLNLMIEHIFSYNSSENKKAIAEKITDKGKANRRNKNNKNINIVQTNNFILNHLTEDLGNKREKGLKIENNYTDINLNKDNNKDSETKNNEEELNDDNDNNTEDDGDKVINCLIATASQNLKNVKEMTINNSITDFDKNFTKENNSKKNNNKKVSFEDELVYINYHQDYKVTNLHITDNDNKTLHFKPKDISKYIKKLTSNNNQLKPIIINANKANYNNIINKIKIKNNNSKINKIKTNQTIQKNIDFIKEVEKRNNSREKSRSKEKYKKKDVYTNSINIKVNKSKVNNKIAVNKK